MTAAHSVARPARRAVIAAAVAVAGSLLAPATARAEPSNQTLVLTGLAMAPPTYLLGVTLHEGSHALAAVTTGATVDILHLFPPGRDPSGTWRFGWTYVRGLRTTGDRVWFYLAPKATDAALIGGFAALVFTGAWPGNRYGQLALTVIATGLWVDFAKDVVLFAPTNDVVKAFDLLELTGWRQIPTRLAYAGMAVGLGLIVARGYQRTFDRSEDGSTIAPAMRASAALTRVFPIATGRF
jgi:hypothetical protein